MIDAGFKNYILKEKIVKIKKPNSSHTKLLISEATLNNRLIDCTQGKKTQSIIILNTDHIVLSALKYSVMESKIRLNVSPLPVLP